MVEVAVLSGLLSGLWLLRRELVGRRLAWAECAGHEVEVRERALGRELVFRSGDGEMIHGRVLRRQPLRSLFPYTDGFHLLPLLVPGARRGLFLGGGAGIGPRQFRALHGQIALDVVELHAQVLALAREHFGLQEGPGLRLLSAEGGDFLRDSRERYDVVVVDVCEVNTVPASFQRPEFFERLRERLLPGGAFVMNAPGALAGPRAGLLRRLARAAEGAFEGLVVLPVPGPGEEVVDAMALRNVLLLGGRGPLLPPERASFPPWLPWAPRLLALLRGELVAGAGGARP